MSRTPPLQLLPAFEASARLGSFRLAAAELHVTPSAVSQQIRALEDALGVRLFDRLTRRVVLTRAGEEWHTVAARVLGDYTRSCEQFRARHQRPVLRVSMAAIVAHELLLPRLHEFQQAHPQIDLRIETGMALVDFGNEPVDAAVRFSSETPAGLAVFPLADASATLVAAPALLQRQSLRQPADLANFTLIHMRREPNDWEAVFTRIGLAGLRPQGELFLDDYFSAMRAAQQGLGIAIGTLPVITPWLLDGRLAAPFPVAIATDQRYQLVCRRETENTPALQAFHAWLLGIFRELDARRPF